MKRYLARWAIGCACAAVMLVLLTASPAFAGGTPQSGSADRGGWPRDPSGDGGHDTGRTIARGAAGGSDSTDEPTRRREAGHEPSTAPSRNCGPHASALAGTVDKGEPQPPNLPDADTEPPKDLPGEPVATPSPGGVAAPVGSAPTPREVVVPASGADATLVSTVVPAASIAQLLPANVPATTPSEVFPATPIEGAGGLPHAAAVVAPPIDDAGARSWGAAFVVLLAATFAFAVLHGRLDRSEPKLTSAPLDGHDQSLDFE